MKMKIKVALRDETLNLLWACGAGDARPVSMEGHQLVELDEDVISEAIDLFDAATLDEAITALIHARGHEGR